MRTVIAIHPRFDEVWPFAAEHAEALLRRQGPVEVVRLEPSFESPISRAIPDPASAGRVLALTVPVSAECAAAFSPGTEIVTDTAVSDSLRQTFADRGIAVSNHGTEAFWGQSVAEFALALTLCGLRRIPQTHHDILTSHDPWNYAPGTPCPGNQRGWQYGDDSRFTNGTLAGKRVRIVGAGNIGSRYASWCSMLGADVAAWDPFAPDPCFHRTGARRQTDLDCLVQDAEIFAPMLPLTDKTRGLITAGQINALPTGCLVVAVTRLQICDVPALRRRVLADELALAADVFDVEPLPFDDPLLGRHNVVHTPHNAGRTRHANLQFAETLVSRFKPVRSASSTNNT